MCWGVGVGGGGWGVGVGREGSVGARCSVGVYHVHNVIKFPESSAAHGGGWVGSLVLLIVTEKKNKSD